MPNVDLGKLWQRPEARDALARRDIPAVYRFLARNGYTQASIARLVGQAQSEVSDILRGRHVQMYPLLERIAEGLSIPRGLMGLSYEAGGPAPGGEEDEDVKRRAFMSLVSSLALGGSVSGDDWNRFIPAMETIPEPFTGVVSPTDAKALVSLVDSFRASDQRFGGYGQYQAALSAVTYGESLVKQANDDRTRRALSSALAYCHGSAGWFATEEGQVDTARYHYHHGLSVAGEAHDPMMRARVLYCAGRTELHFGDPAHATKLFQLGSVGVDRSPLMRSVLSANAAWAGAHAGWTDYSKRQADLAREYHDQVDFSRDTPMFRWFGAEDLAGVTGAASIARADYEAALEELTLAAGGRPTWQHRSLVFDTSNLARVHLLLGDTDAAMNVGEQAIGHIRHVRSARLPGRVNPLIEETARCKGSDLRQLNHELQRSLDAKAVQA